ncbi:MAG TPA: hypothetical protein VIG06_02220 [Kofleriaceae bacterium]
MNLRRFASLALLTASFSFLMAGSTGCVVHSRGRGGGHPARASDHHCHPKSARHVCHAHPHGPNHHP